MVNHRLFNYFDKHSSYLYIGDKLIYTAYLCLRGNKNANKKKGNNAATMRVELIAPLHMFEWQQMIIHHFADFFVKPADV